jgi:tRNA/rRNA methyltransferase
MDLARVRVVLVRPKIAGNLGATARIMRNMGLRDLVLVAPEADPTDPNARRLSTHGQEILDRARTTSSLKEALEDCLMVAVTSARIGGPYRRQAVGCPDEIMPRLLAVLDEGPIALVFGPEPTGLEDHEISRGNFLIHIPADPGYQALNLAQAVTICLYELRRAWLRQTMLPSSPGRRAPFAEQDRMFAHLQSALEEIHYLYGPSAGALMHALRHLIGRAGPTKMEVDLLFGLARQIHWFAANRAENQP